MVRGARVAFFQAESSSLDFVGSTLGAFVLVASAALAGCGDSGGGAGGSAATGGTNGATSTKAAATNASATTQAAAGTTTSGTGGGMFPCSGMPLPTTAPATINVAGKTVSVGLGGQTPLATVSLEVFVGTNATPVATATSDAMGVYTIPLNTGGSPLDGYIHGSKATYIDSYLYPPAPLAADTMQATVLVINSNTFSLLQSFAVVTQNAGDGFLGVVVSDCNNMPVAGATVTTVPAGPVKYNMGGIPTSNATSTDIDGVAYVFNLTPGDVTVQATASGTTLREHVVNVRPDVITTTAILP